MILIDSGLLPRIGTEIALPSDGHLVIITDTTVAQLYGEALFIQLAEQGRTVDILVIPPGEDSKSQEMKTHLEHHMLELGVGRDGCVLALGGGVVGDLAGFVAATYLRGISVVQIPTTLLAMVDSGLGGKTAVNTPHGKNLIGAFWPPEQIIMDLETLHTLPQAELLSGLVEGFKILLTSDGPGFERFEKQVKHLVSKDFDTLRNFIHTTVELKAGIVSRDARERGERVILNAGHTVAHALEHCSHYTLPHGHAVAYGLLLEAKIAEQEGHLSPADYRRMAECFAQLGFHLSEFPPYDAGELLEAIRYDKKGQKIVRLTGIGKVLESKEGWAQELSSDRLRAALDLIRS